MDELKGPYSRIKEKWRSEDNEKWSSDACYRRIAVRGSEIKGGVDDASLHSAMFDSARVRGVLRCHDAIDRVEERVAAFLARSSLWVKAERSRRRQHFLFVHFSIPVPVQVRMHEPVHVGRNEWNKIKLPCQLVTFTAIFGHTLHWRATSTSGFFHWTLLQKDSERCVLIDFDLQNYSSLSLSFGGDFPESIHVCPSSWARLEFAQEHND